MGGYDLVKRLHLVGTSKDGKKLVFAQKKGAKFGSFETPIGPKLLRLVEEHRRAREEKRKPAEAAGAAAGPPESEPAAPVRTDRQPPPGAEAPTGLGGPIGVVGSDQIDIPMVPVPRPAEMDQPLPGIAGSTSRHPSNAAPPPEPEAEVARIERITPRTEKPEIPVRSKLSPAEIQALIRAGRGIRSVANLAGTPVDWVRYLAEPIQEERRGIVRQMLLRRQERARLGMSATSVGEAIYENLRARGIRSPETVIEEGFTAFRPDGGDWRVRFVFEHRGRRQTANWSFDPQTRKVTPLNPLASGLGWRRGANDGEAATPARPRRSPPRGRARTLSGSSRKRSTRKATPARRKRRTSRG